MVPDSKFAVGVLRMYQEGGHCGDNIHHEYAHILGTQRPASKTAINIMVTPSHWITAINVHADAAITEEPQMDHT